MQDHLELDANKKFLKMLIKLWERNPVQTKGTFRYPWKILTKELNPRKDSKKNKKNQRNEKKGTLDNLLHLTYAF